MITVRRVLLTMLFCAILVGSIASTTTPNVYAQGATEDIRDHVDDDFHAALQFAQSLPAGWYNGLPDCPDTVAEAQAQPDIWEDVTDGWFQNLPRFHPGATHSFRSSQGYYAERNSDGTPHPGGQHGQQCTYANGKLITSGSAAGTPDFWASNSPIRHNVEDVWNFNDLGWQIYSLYWPPNRGASGLDSQNITPVWLEPGTLDKITGSETIGYKDLIYELPPAIVGQGYSVQLRSEIDGSISGPGKHVIFDSSGDELPPGLNITTDGLITGTPLAEATNTRFTFTIEVTYFIEIASNTVGYTGSQTYSITVLSQAESAPTATPTPIPDIEPVCPIDLSINLEAIDRRSLGPRGWIYDSRFSGVYFDDVSFDLPGSASAYSISFIIDQEGGPRIHVPCFGCRDPRAEGGPTRFGPIGPVGSPTSPPPCAFMDLENSIEELEVEGILWRVFRGNDGIQFDETVAITQINGITFVVSYTGLVGFDETDEYRREIFEPAISAYTREILGTRAEPTEVAEVAPMPTFRNIESSEDCRMNYGETVRIAVDNRPTITLYLEVIDGLSRAGNNPDAALTTKAEELERLLRYYCDFEHQFEGNPGDNVIIRLTSDTLGRDIDPMTNLGMLLYHVDETSGTETPLVQVATLSEGPYLLRYAGTYRIEIVAGFDPTIIEALDYTLSLELESSRSATPANPPTPWVFDSPTPGGAFPTDVAILPTPTPIQTEIADQLNTATPNFSTPAAAVPPVTLVPTPSRCSGSLPSRMTIGESGQVTPGDSNNLRDNPSVSARLIGQIPGGGQFTVLAGPECANEFAWWQVDYQGLVGWTVEGNSSSYWIEPLTNAVANSTTNVNVPAPSDANSCMVSADGPVNRRSGPGTTYDNVGQMTPDQQMAVEAYTISTSNFIWWKLADGSWVREDVVDTIGDCSTVPKASQ